MASLIRNNPLPEPYSRTMSRAIWWAQVLFLMSEVPLQAYEFPVEAGVSGGRGGIGFGVQGSGTTTGVANGLGFIERKLMRDPEASL